MQYLFISHTIGLTDLQPSPASFFKLFSYFRSGFRSVQFLAQYKAVTLYNFTSAFLNFKPNLQVTRILFLLNTTLAVAVLDLISLIHVASFICYATQVVAVCIPHSPLVFIIFLLVMNMCGLWVLERGV